MRQAIENAILIVNAYKTDTRIAAKDSHVIIGFNE